MVAELPCFWNQTVIEEIVSTGGVNRRVLKTVMSEIVSTVVAGAAVFEANSYRVKLSVPAVAEHRANQTVIE